MFASSTYVRHFRPEDRCRFVVLTELLFIRRCQPVQLHSRNWTPMNTRRTLTGGTRYRRRAENYIHGDGRIRPHTSVTHKLLRVIILPIAHA
jgi:hypothetical protein